MTKIMGILNVTPDSFSDGGRYLDLKSAIKQLEIMIEQGADIIDIGGQSTRPNAKIISEDEEWNRLEPILKHLKNNKFNVEISIDSFHANIIKQSLDIGIDYINDVNGLKDSEMLKVAAQSGKKVILMHSLTVPADKNITLAPNINVIKFLQKWLKQRIKELQKAGIKKDKIIFDAGIGFGKTSEQSLEIIQNISAFKKFGVEILVGHSEKSFLSLFTNKPAGQRNVETEIISYLMAKQKIDYLRVHNVDANKRAVLMANNF
jgi:dihydropteroate synthase